MPEGYQHGPINCRLCFNQGSDVLILNDWRLRNNPGYYGSNNPEILVLGFSKGATQNKATETGDFDKVAFAGARRRLQRVFETLKIMPNDRGIDDLLTARERTFGIASLVRCSFCKIKGNKCITSGEVIPTAFSNPLTKEIIQRCAAAFLSNLPDRLRLVVLLGTSDIYIERTRSIISNLYTNFASVNECAFYTGRILWIYAAHPSPGNGHFLSWTTSGEQSKQGKKRIQALQAIEALV